MRAYTFTNFMLSSLQKGLQTAHVISELQRLSKKSCADIYNEWASEHKTIIILNGGNSKQLREIFNKFNDTLSKLWFKYPVPYAAFHEDEDSLDGALTATGCILHHRYWIPINVFRKFPNLNALENMPIESVNAEVFYKELYKEANLNNIPWSAIDYSNYSHKELELINFIAQFGLAI